jgi:hypothetical protein
MDVFLLVIMLAITVEGLIEYAKSIVKLATEKDKRPLLIQLCALAVAIGLAILAGADFYSAFGVNFALAWVGTVLTGVFLSRGSNYVSDLIGRLRNGGGTLEDPKVLIK